ncbi:MAG: HEPN domain-containing protein [Candidatus Woesearchaeota archaeon]
MDSKVELYLKRARNELEIAKLLFTLSGNKKLNEFDLDENETFYSSVISHSYYCIFYSAKAILLKN